MSNFEIRLEAEFLAGMLDHAAVACELDARAIESGKSEPYDRALLVEFLRNLDKTFRSAANAIRFALDDDGK